MRRIAPSGAARRAPLAARALAPGPRARASAGLALLAALAASPAAAQEPAPRFPRAAPESVGLDAAKLAELAGFVRELAAKDEIVGAELLVIKDDKTVLHEAFGWKDREDELPMVVDTIFCVRSMTKPLVGTAVGMLISEGKLALDDPVAKHLPSFDNDRSRAITVEMLLHHRGGLPLSGLLGRDLASVTGVRDVADAAGAKGPEHPPGERFSYSDDGADTLGALVEVAAGRSLEEFVAERILRPVGMADAIPVVSVGHEKRARIASNYLGSPGAWTRYWSPKDPPLFPALLASQSLYCTPADYARFVAMWKDRGRAGGARLITSAQRRRALEPGVEMGYPTGFRGLATDYGEMWMLYVDRSSPEEKLVAFGHGGSDGTFAYCFPELDLIALYFTQSRGTLSGFAFEEALQRCVLDPLTGAQSAPLATYSEADLTALAGEYWSEEHEELALFLRRGARLFLELPGRALLDVKPTTVKDRWVVALSPVDTFEFQRSERGAADVVVGRSKDPQGREVAVTFARLVPDPDLPSVDELEALRKQGVDWDRIAALGVCRASGSFAMPARGIAGTFTTLAQGTTRFRSDIDMGAMQVKVALDGARGWTFNSATTLQEVEGVALDQLRLDQPFRRVASWRACFKELRVLRKVPFDDTTALLVLGVPPHANPRAMYVDAQTGLLLAEGTVASIPGLGEVGAWVDYDDWRDVGGVKLPFHVTVEYATPLLGTSDSRWEQVETEAAVAPDAFTLADVK